MINKLIVKNHKGSFYFCYVNLYIVENKSLAFRNYYAYFKNNRYGIPKVERQFYD